MVVMLLKLSTFFIGTAFMRSVPGTLVNTGSNIELKFGTSLKFIDPPKLSKTGNCIDVSLSVLVPETSRSPPILTKDAMSIW